MRGVKCGLEEEGVVTAVGVDRDVHRAETGFFQFEDEGGLFLRIEAEIGIDGKDQEAMTRFPASAQEFLIVSGVAFTGSVVT